MNVKIEESWRKRLQEEFDKPYFEKLVAFVKSEYGHANVLPPGHQIFHVFNSCPFEKVKVVILGQDPYPNPGQYYGVCFSVPKGVAIPGSLANIFKEIHQDLGKPIPTSGNLDRWVAQGVFPMNSVLTVRAHETGSHRNMGWEIFTDAVIKKLSDERENLVFMLWGAYAKEKAALINSSRHLILTTVHPSPRIIRKTKCFDFWERNVLFPKTKRSFFRTPKHPLPCPFPLNFSLLIITKKFGNLAKNRYICIV